MRSFSIKQKADWMLACSAIGILAAFPFHDSFLGGLLFSLFSAATIGGLADSFAIAALFGNPLRIKWPRWMGTNIIVRNRERLVRELVTMVQNELLTVANVKERLEEYDIAKVLLAYLQEHGGKQGVNDILQQAADDIISTIDLRELAVTVQTFLLEHADTIEISDTIADVGDWTLRNRYDDQIIAFMLPELVKIVRSAPFRLAVNQLIDAALRSYEGEQLRRKLMDASAGLDTASLSTRLQEWLVRFLHELTAEKHPQWQKLKAFIADFVVRLRTDAELRGKVEAGKVKALHSIKQHIRLDEYIEAGLAKLRSAARANATEQRERYPWITGKVQEAVDMLAKDESMQRKLDDYLKTTLLKWLEQKHSYVGKAVADKLNEFSEEELITLVKDKAGKDLQYIRINGIGIGALIGVVLYMLTFWIGR
jgi:uncharacterized membrane-anchored protein YjiN (DUF445 family)